MFDHVTIRASDRAASEEFYDGVLSALGIAKAHSDAQLAEWGDFSLSPATEERPVTRRLHVGFVARSHEVVDEFWRVGIGVGYRSDGEPGPRPQYSAEYYGSFLLDPDGLSVEAVVHEATAERAGIDHVWMRVADLDRSRRFYLLVAPFGGFTLRTDTAERVSFRGPSGSLSLLPGDASANVHLAFPATADATVEGFHAATTAVGFRDNGAPGERRAYHPGYYGAFVLDPDGNNVEVVNHNRGVTPGAG